MVAASKVAAPPPSELTPFGYALAGALGGVFSNASVTPDNIPACFRSLHLHSTVPCTRLTRKNKLLARSGLRSSWLPCRVKTRIQADTGKGKGKEASVSALMVRILKEEGIGGYYKGFGASMINTFSMRASPQVLPLWIRITVD